MRYHQTLIIHLHSLQISQIIFKVFKFHSVCIPERKRNGRLCLPVTSLSWQSFMYSQLRLFPATFSCHPIKCALKLYVKSREAGRDEDNVNHRHKQTHSYRRSHASEAGKTALENTLLERFPLQTPVETGAVGGNLCFDCEQRHFLCFCWVFFFSNLRSFRNKLILAR